MKKNILLMMSGLVVGSMLFANTLASVVSAPTIVIPVDTLKNKAKQLAVAQKLSDAVSGKISTSTWSINKIESGNDLAKGIEFSNPFPNPANQQTGINFQLPSPNSEARVMLRNLLGSVVKEIRVTGAENRFFINTSDLNNGLYFYSVMFENRVLFTKKLIVKH
ncbi:MAG: T9SS type A sorting domain-containing protein [Bacteroidota bacterium]|nr:T9SS type A sorting domain-containing protein [Bacteroidota bacterium]